MIHPVVARLPRPGVVQTVVSPPYDALSPADRYHYAQTHPDNFLSVILAPEDHPPPAPDPVELGRRARVRLQELLDEHYTEPREPTFYIYEMAGPAHRQRGVVGALQAGDAGRVLGHERVIAPRVAALRAFYEATGINTSPIAVTFRPRLSLRRGMDEVTGRAPDLEYHADDGVVHRVWSAGSSLAAAVTEIDQWYITDGHHRIAAAMSGEPDANVLVVGFPADELEVYGYHRVLGVPLPADFSQRVAPDWEMQPVDGRIEPEPGVIGLCARGRWYRLVRRRPRPEDPVDRLDVVLLHGEILGRALGIEDESLIAYQVGADPAAALEAATDDRAIGFLLAPPSIEDIMAVADAGRWLPPKSTWFAPKVRSGLLVVER